MRRIILGVLCAVGMMGLTTLPANAQATRTWVSGVGDDANPCSRTAPCKTFAGTISKTAAGGEINCLDPGGFGAVTITKSITIDCAGTLGSTLHGGTNGFIVNIAGGFVVLRNLSINGAPPTVPGTNGIRIITSGKVLIQNVNIFGESTNGIIAEPATGVLNLSIQDTTVHNITNGGILLKPAAAASVNASLTRVNMHYSLFGLRAEDRSKVSVFESAATENTNNGFLAVSTAAGVEISIMNSIASNNGAAGVSASGAGSTIRLFNTMVTNNVTGINLAGGNVHGTLPDSNSIVGNTTDGAVNGNVTQQ